ncbi:MAG: Hsp20/alpha crystallin family protein [bacterium]
MDTENKFEIKDNLIRYHFDQKTNKWHFSIVDVMSIITKSSDARNYWKVLKNRLKKRGNELVTKCNQLKMKSNDGKYYLTDAADEETMLEIIALVSKDYVSPFMRWLLGLNSNKSASVMHNANSLGILSEDKTDSYPQIKSTAEDFEENIDEDMELLIDGYETNEHIIIQAMVAGVSPKNIFIFTNGKILKIKGERIKTKEILEENYYNKELYWGKFSRTIELPTQIKTKKIITTCENQILTIKLEKLDANII